MLNFKTCLEQYLGKGNFRKTELIAGPLDQHSQLFADIRKTFGPLMDHRTGNHMENPSFTGPPRLFQDLIYFHIEVLIEGLPTGFF